MQSIAFDNNGLAMAGSLFLPPGFDDARSYPAILSVHPGGGVKEQAAGVYAQQLSGHGFVTLAFDTSHQGASEGTPRPSLALLIGLNLGPNLFVAGSLAWLLWLRAARDTGAAAVDRPGEPYRRRHGPAVHGRRTGRARRGAAGDGVL